MMQYEAEPGFEPHPPSDATPTAWPDAGGRNALAAFCDRHAATVYSLVMRITGEPADAESIAHGALAGAWAQNGGHPDREPDTHRVFSAARIRAIDHLRASGDATPGQPGRAASFPAAAAGGAAGASADDVATLQTPEPVWGGISIADAFGEAPRLRAAFRELPPLERLAIEMAYFDGLTISRIAALLEQTPDAANTRIRNGLRRLAGRSAEAQPVGEARHGLPQTRDLAGLYALGALNASERAAFDAHLEVHRDAVDDVLALLPVARRLAWMAPPYEPPPGLRDRVLDTLIGAPLAPTVEAVESEPFSSDEAGGADDRPDASSAPVDAEARPDEAGGERDDAWSRAEPDDSGTAPNQIRGSAEPDESGVNYGSTGPSDFRSNQLTDTASAEPGGTGRVDIGDSLPVDEAPDAERAAGPGEASSPAAGEAAPPGPTPPLQEPTQPMQSIATVPESPAILPTPAATAEKQGRGWGLPLLAAASLLAAAGTGWFAVQQRDLAAALQENLDAANTRTRIAELETEAARRGADELRAGAAVLTAPDVQPLDLGGQPAAPDARGRLFWSASAGGVLTVTGLPPAPAGQIYQLWLIPDAEPMHAALLAPDAEGRAMVTVALPEGLTGLVPAAVTLELAGGAENPGGDVHLLGQP